MSRGRWLVCLLVAACAFEPTTVLEGDGARGDGAGRADSPSGDGAARDGEAADGTVLDGPVRDGPSPDASPADASPPDAHRADARPCPASLPSGCSGGTPFLCPGSSSCFLFCPGGRTHSGAETVCQGWDAVAHLASPIGAELTCAGAQVNESLSSGDNVWIGLRQTGSPLVPGEGWSWLDGTSYAPGGWGTSPVQPDDYDGEENGMEDCGNLERAFGWLWNDGDCADSFPFLCERP